MVEAIIFRLIVLKIAILEFQRSKRNVKKERVLKTSKGKSNFKTTWR